MNQEKLLQDVASLPPIAQKEAIDFIAFLKTQYGQYSAKSSEKVLAIKSEPFIGMWKNRSDMTDSNAWVRNMREKEWS
jgi:uncharacterized phage-associated protein